MKDEVTDHNQINTGANEEACVTGCILTNSGFITNETMQEAQASSLHATRIIAPPDIRMVIARWRG